MECLLPYLSIVTVSHIMVVLERMLDYRGVGLERFHCTSLFVCTTAGMCDDIHKGDVIKAVNGTDVSDMNLREVVRT